MDTQYISDCALNEPYPDISGLTPDADTAELIMQDYSAAASEMTALSEYMYQHAALLKSYPSTAEKLECIALVEMNHATLLARAIKQLGGDPRYLVVGGSDKRYWTGGDVNYGKLARDAIMRDIRDEKAAASQYRLHASAVTQPQLRALLIRIARDEDFHAQILAGLLSSLA